MILCYSSKILNWSHLLMIADKLEATYSLLSHNPGLVNLNSNSSKFSLRTYSPIMSRRLGDMLMWLEARATTPQVSSLTIPVN